MFLGAKMCFILSNEPEGEKLWRQHRAKESDSGTARTGLEGAADRDRVVAVRRERSPETAHRRNRASARHGLR